MNGTGKGAKWRRVRELVEWIRRVVNGERKS